MIHIEYEPCVDFTQSDILDEFIDPFKFETPNFNVDYSQYHLSEDIFGDRHYALQFVSLLQNLNFF